MCYGPGRRPAFLTQRHGRECGRRPGGDRRCLDEADLRLARGVCGMSFAPLPACARMPMRRPPRKHRAVRRGTTTATIHVTVENVESDKGRVWVALCTTELSVEGCPYQTSVAATAGIDEVTFEDIPPGTMRWRATTTSTTTAASTKILKVPREPYALSGAAGERLVPTFKDAALPISRRRERGHHPHEAARRLTIRLAAALLVRSRTTAAARSR